MRAITPLALQIFQHAIEPNTFYLSVLKVFQICMHRNWFADRLFH